MIGSGYVTLDLPFHEFLGTGNHARHEPEDLRARFRHILDPRVGDSLAPVPDRLRQAGVICYFLSGLGAG